MILRATCLSLGQVIPASLAEEFVQDRHTASPEQESECDQLGFYLERQDHAHSVAVPLGSAHRVGPVSVTLSLRLAPFGDLADS